MCKHSWKLLNKHERYSAGTTDKDIDKKGVLPHTLFYILQCIKCGKIRKRRIR